MTARVKKEVEVVHSGANNSPSNEARKDYSAIFQTIYLIFGIINTILFIRFIFRLTGANPAAGIVDFTYAITDIFMAPFNYIFPQTNVEGAVFEWSVLVAIAFYSLLSWIITQIIKIIYTQDVG